MAKQRRPMERDRLVQCTDAIVAIAITLLVLPLVDLVGESIRNGASSVKVLTDHWPQIYSFLLSFGVIALLWRAHHRLFGYIETATNAVYLWNLLWILTIVALPFPTEMVASYHDDRFTVVFYVGTILLSTTCLTTMMILAARNQEISGPDGVPYREMPHAIADTGLTVLVFLLVAFLPVVTYLPLLLLLLAPGADRLYQRKKAGMVE